MNAQRHAQRAPAAGLERVEFRLLGPLEALVEGEAVPLGGPKQRALLAHLLLRADEAVPADELVDALWPEEPPPSARHAIHVYVSRLRRVLGSSRIEAHSRAYLLRTEPEETDLGRVRRLVTDARAALGRDDPGEAAALLQDALALWRERPLADLEGEPGVRDLLLELEEERVEAVELRLRAELQAGRDGELVPELERLVAEHPAREQLHAELMLALHRAGRREDALDAYRRAQQRLRDELGLEPTLRLRELAAAIRRRDPALTPEPDELRTRRHLPVAPNQFIGRARELAELVGAITHGARLVTLTGAGGIGKTRLALAAAGRLAAHFEDGVWFADLSALVDPSLVVPALAQTVGARESADHPAQAALEAQLAQKHLLLVVDNFEQVADAAPALSRLLRSSPRLALLVTSRSPLRLFGEEEYEVPPLALPDPHGAQGLAALARLESVQLLVARARAAERAFELDEGNARPIAEVCVALDGLPLALELAAATLKDFSPSELRERLTGSLGLRVGGPVDVPARQRTMHAAIAWSYGLLEAHDRQLFARLAVFSGGWTAEAARDVCGATEADLASLRQKALVRSDGRRQTMLAPIREFALEQLPPQEAARLVRAHAGYFTALAESADERAQGIGPGPELLDALGRDYENLRAALAAGRDDGERVLVARLAAALGDYWSIRGPYGEGRAWLEVALDAPVEDAALLGRIDRGLGFVCMQQAAYAEAAAAFERALEHFRAIGDREMQASCLGNLGGMAAYLGDHAKARELLTEGRNLAVELGNELTLTGLANVLGIVELVQGRLAEAEGWFEESLMVAERNGNREGSALALLNLGVVALQTDRVEDAASGFRAAVRLADELQHAMQTANCLLGLAAVAARRGDPARAGRLLGSSDAVLADCDGELEPLLSALESETRAAVRADLGDAAAAEAIATGRAQGRREALADATSD